MKIGKQRVLVVLLSVLVGLGSVMAADVKLAQLPMEQLLPVKGANVVAETGAVSGLSDVLGSASNDPKLNNFSAHIEKFRVSFRSEHEKVLQVIYLTLDDGSQVLVNFGTDIEESYENPNLNQYIVFYHVSQFGYVYEFLSKTANAMFFFHNFNDHEFLQNGRAIIGTSLEGEAPGYASPNLGL